jgi:penicillin-binding protein 1A
LPVDIWSRFMRTAHQGVPVASLPGTSRGFASADFSLPWSRPPAEVPAPANRAPATQASGMDTWLIDKLFGRR